MKTCTRCIMNDSSDPTITFDSQGRCNYCTRDLARVGVDYFPNAEGQRRLTALLNEIKKAGEGKPYDCAMGISGGLDSSYLAYLGYKWGLRILAVHVDDGFDTEISKGNIKKLCDAAHLKLITLSPDGEQCNALTKAYMKAGVPNLAVPQDNVLFAGLYQYMRKNGIKYFMTGSNVALEGILQAGNTFSAHDLVNLRDIHRRFGEKPIDKLPLISFFQTMVDKRLLGIHTERPLDLVVYNRKQAFQELYDFCGFEYYGSKHLENILTAFVQLYWFPKKFGVDKRYSHLSSMVISGQMTREEALEEVAKPMYDEKMMEEYIRIVKERLHISDAEFDEIMAAPTHQHADYKISWFEHTFWPKVYAWRQKKKLAR